MDIAEIAKIVTVLTVSVAVGAALILFHKYCVRRFQYPVFGMRPLLRLAISIALIVGGGWALKGPNSREEWSTVLFIAGGVLLWWSLGQNFVRTNILHGAIATALQMFVICVCGPAVALVGFTFGGMVFVICSLIVPIFVIGQQRRL